MRRELFRRQERSAAAPEAPVERRPRLSELGDVVDLRDPAPAVDERSERYSAWAERMRVKRARFQEQLTSTGDDPQIDYWSTEVLYESSRDVVDEETFDRPSPARIESLLAILDLTAEHPGIEALEPGELNSAYRRLAKLHHPDRYVEADAETQAFHEAEMARINAAYRALRSLQPR